MILSLVSVFLLWVSWLDGQIEKSVFDFFPSNAFLRRRRKKALLRVNDRGGGWKTCILALCRVCVTVYACVRACPSDMLHVCS